MLVLTQEQVEKIGEYFQHYDVDDTEDNLFFMLDRLIVSDEERIIRNDTTSDLLNMIRQLTKMLRNCKPSNDQQN
ncbi:hypothetical protein [Pedobacter sp. N23S346]|uniref:hypothetical protein n=1 Tax=Pedobacter sp. N23S346 TaxID=3402750 RepID=UPI003ACD7E59